MTIKQVLIIRADLKMRRGKEIAQASHASSMWLAEHILQNKTITDITDTELQWLKGDFTKITLQVSNEQELVEIHNKALQAGLKSYLITDLGKTEFHGQLTKTCCAIGPDDANLIDPITKHLKLY